MKKYLMQAISAAFLCFFPICATAQTDVKIFSSHFADGAWVTALSNNGRYAVFSAYTPENTLYDYYAKLYDTETDEVIDLMADADVELSACGANDVSDTGIVVGTYGTGYPIANPAYWEVDKGWTILPYPEGEWEGGIVTSITPDGKLCCGKVYRQAMMEEEPMLWDISGETPVRIDTPNIPRIGSAGEDHKMVRFTELSPDGRFVTGCVSYSYTWDTRFFVYDLKTNETVTFGRTPIDGVEVKNPEGYRLSFSANYSPNGRLVAGTARTSNGNVPATLDIYTGEVKVYDGEPIEDGFVSITDDGVFYLSTPSLNPMRSWSVRCGSYWVPFDEILKQHLNTSLERLTGYQDITSGTVMGISGDGLTIASLIYNQTGESYVVRLPESADKMAANINLLDNYSTSPIQESELSAIRTVQVGFDRNIMLDEEADKPYIENEAGDVIAKAIRCETDPLSDTLINISFRAVALKDGEKYRVVIPAGMVAFASEPMMKNREIRITYIGRSARPVELVDAVPEDGSKCAKLSMSSNPVILTFDTRVSVTPNAGGAFYRINGEEREYLCALGMSATGKSVYVYPAIDQNLFDGEVYELELLAGSIGDILSENPNEAIVLRYDGSYVPEFVSDFSNNFDDGSWISEFMFYEGDHNQPAQVMVNWNFMDGDNYPWWWVRDSLESPDYALASHSMYSPSGQSDDWLIIPHLYVSDDEYATTLNFKSQSYLKSKKDRLKVVVWATNRLTSIPTEDFMKAFKEEGIVVYDKEQSPGSNEELLAGEWMENTIDLSDFKGKGVYIAFVNDNRDQSAVFIDDVAVKHEVDFAISIDSERSVVAQDALTIKGRIRINTPEEIYTYFDLSLIDADGNTIDTRRYEGLDLKQGDMLQFEFEKGLPLRYGVTQVYTVSARNGERTVVATGKVVNLYFRPEKRVLLEEYTGQDCGYCPLGIMMIKRLEQAFGDRIVPVAIHTYQGDNLASGLQGYSAYLNINNAAPSAAIDRDGGIYMPMATINGRYVYTNPESPLWWDAVSSALQCETVADITMTDGSAVYDLEAGVVMLPVETTFALDVDNANYNLMGVIVEDGVKGVQSNNLAGSTDPLAGEWGAGGKYNRVRITNYIYNDVARGIIGTTYNGTPGLIPNRVKGGTTYHNRLYMDFPEYVENIENCHAIAILLDGNTGAALNVCKTPLTRVTNVEEIADGERLAVRVLGDKVTVVGSGIVELSVYSADGMLVAHSEGTGSVSADLTGTGVMIVKAKDRKGSITKKLMR